MQFSRCFARELLNEKNKNDIDVKLDINSYIIGNN